MIQVPQGNCKKARNVIFYTSSGEIRDNKFEQDNVFDDMMLSFVSCLIRSKAKLKTRSNKNAKRIGKNGRKNSQNRKQSKYDDELEEELIKMAKEFQEIANYKLKYK